MIAASSPHLPDASKVRSPLLDQVRRAVRVRHYSIRTERAYVDWVCGIKSPLTRVRKIQAERRAAKAPVASSPAPQAAPQPPPAVSAPAEKIGLIVHERRTRSARRGKVRALLQRVGFAAMWAAAFFLGRRPS